MSALSTSLLSQTIDDHTEWMTAWSRIAFYEITGHAAQAEKLRPPASFTVWWHEAVKDIQDQPALDRLAALYDQLHRAARMAILKSPPRGGVARGDFDLVAGKYHDLMDALRRLEKALAAAASGIDALTGLRSRAGLEEDLGRELNRFRRSGQPFCLAMMDIDHFKKVNDVYGHDGGDKVLSAVANHIGRNLRPFDDVWRWGGEEFLICLKDVGLVAGSIALERVRGGLEKMPIKVTAGRTVTVTASFGVVAAAAQADLEALITEADQALYRAKNAGRNRIEASAVMMEQAPA